MVASGCGGCGGGGDGGSSSTMELCMYDAKAGLGYVLVAVKPRWPRIASEIGMMECQWRLSGGRCYINGWELWGTAAQNSTRSIT